MSTANTATTQSDETVLDYSYKMRVIVNKWGSDFGINSESQLLEEHFYAFHKLFLRVLSTNTVKKYRVVMRWQAKRMGIELDSSKLGLEGKKFKRSNKGKMYPKALRLQVVNKIDETPWRANPDTKTFLKLHLILGPYLGYRMVELIGMRVEIIGNKVQVRIKNGKNSNGRANGEFRTLVYPKIHNGLDFSKQFQRLVEFGDRSDYNEIVKSASKLHKKILDRIDTSEIMGSAFNPVMTSTRHEFKLAFREANGDLITSAAMGHKSMITQQRDYGDKTTKGKLKFKEKRAELVEFLKNVEVDVLNVSNVTTRISEGNPTQGSDYISKIKI